MLTRIKSGAIFVLCVCLFLVLSHLPGAVTVTVALLCAGALGELGRAWQVRHMASFRLLGLVMGALLTLIPGKLLIPGTFAFIGLVLVCWRVMGRLPDPHTLALWEKGVIAAAVVVLLSMLGPLRQRPYGLQELVLGLFVCIATDSFAYLFGRKYGKHPLAPAVSPKKTLEGAACGTLAAALMTVAICALLELAGFIQVRFGLLTLYVLWASLVGQYGDLCMSAVKRAAGIKDFGDLLPGHGGLLDRLDSHLLALPFTYIVFSCCGSVFYGG